jgi:hypothetical protein
MRDYSEAVAEIILSQLGGNKFIVMTGSKNFINDSSTGTLRMDLVQNKSKSNKLWITLKADDTYTMRFFKYTGVRFDRKTCTMKDSVTKEVKVIEGVYCDMLQDIFTDVTGLYTHL